MGIEHVTPGKNAPDEFNVIIEIAQNADPVKYEVDKDTGMLTVDRFMNTAMFYPCNYGYVPHTLSDDGDPVDVLVWAPYPIQPGAVVECRAVGMLGMTDEKGEDAKILAVPTDRISNNIYAHVRDVDDVPDFLKQQIGHFFEHYKDLENGKWVKMEPWQNAAAAHAEINASVARERERG